MTQEYTDDVTGKLITGERWWRVNGLNLGDGMLPAQDFADVDTLLEVLRDHLTGEGSPLPIDVYTMARVGGVKPPAFARYADPVTDAPETLTTDAPFGPLRSFKIPTFGASKYRFIPAVPPAAPAPDPQYDALKARADKARAKYVRAVAALCGCNDIDQHERIS